MALEAVPSHAAPAPVVVPVVAEKTAAAPNAAVPSHASVPPADAFAPAAPSGPTAADVTQQMATPIVPVLGGLGTFLYTPQADFFNELQKDPNVTLQGLLASGPQALKTFQTDDSTLFDGRLGELYAARCVNRLQRTDGEFAYANGVSAFRRAVRGMAVLEAVPPGQLSAELVRPPSKGTPSLLESLNRACGAELSHAQLDALAPALQEASAALANPTSDVVQVAATLQQKLDAAYPPGRDTVDVPRLLMERVLAERGLPPPILADLTADDRLDTPSYSEEIRQGVQRTVHFASGWFNAPGMAFTSRYSYPEYASTLGLSTTFQAKGPSRIHIEGLPYALGPDGFVYNMNGRPHLADGQGQLQPLPQLNHYFALRRLAQSAEPQAALTAYTQATRDLFDAAAADPKVAASLKVPDDRAAILADDAYRTHFSGSNNDAYLQLFDPARSTPANLLTSYGYGSPAATTMATHQLLDLELWNVQQGLEAAGDTKGVATMEAYRSTLHQMARTMLQSEAVPSFQGPANPMGFQYAADSEMFQHHALRYETFADYRKAEDDSQMFVWRGDTGISRFSGVYPDHSLQELDAHSLEAKRAQHLGTQNIIGALERDEGSSNGTGFMCTSPDANVAAQFGNGETRVGVQELPKKLQDAVAALPPGSQVSVAKLRDQLGLVDPRYRLSLTQVDLRGLSLEDVKKALESCAYDVPLHDEVLKRATALLAAQPQGAVGKYLESAESKPLVLDLSKLPSSYLPAPGSPFPAPSDEALANTPREAINLLRDYVVITKDAQGSASVVYPKRALLLRVDKKDGVPGCQTFAGGFVNEKEWTMTHAARRAQVVGAMRPGDLQAENPVTAPPAQVANPAAPATPPAPASA